MQLESRAKAFHGIAVAPRTAIVERTGMTKLLRTELNETRDLLDNVIDRLVRQFEREHPQFVSEYFQARKRVKNGRRSGQKDEGGRMKDETPISSGDRNVDSPDEVEMAW